MKTNAIFKCIVEFANGTHKIVRMTIEKVAMFNAAFRQMRQPIGMDLLCERYRKFFEQIDVQFRQIVSAKFINERTGEELLTLA